MPDISVQLLSPKMYIIATYMYIYMFVNIRVTYPTLCMCDTNCNTHTTYRATLYINALSKIKVTML